MSRIPKISICIPAYEMHGHGATFLANSFEILRQQTYTDFEVVVADQSNDNSVAETCASFPDLSIRHIWTRDQPRQGSANTNVAIDAAKGEIVKILFQDDFLNGPDALGGIVLAFDDNNVLWCLNGSECTEDGQALIRPMIPQYHSRIQFGKNTVSSPSVLALRRKNAPRFDENLVWLMDVDYYKQCELRFGPPTIIPEFLIVNRIHDGQVSATTGSKLKRQELQYIARKYSTSLGMLDWAHYARRLVKYLR